MCTQDGDVPLWCLGWEVPSTVSVRSRQTEERRVREKMPVEVRGDSASRQRGVESHGPGTDLRIFP